MGKRNGLVFLSTCEGSQNIFLCPQANILGLFSMQYTRPYFFCTQPTFYATHTQYCFPLFILITSLLFLSICSLSFFARIVACPGCHIIRVLDTRNLSDQSLSLTCQKKVRHLKFPLQTRVCFLSIYLQIDGYLCYKIIHTSYLLHVTLNHIARSGYEILLSLNPFLNNFPMYTSVNSKCLTRIWRM